ncbi:S10 family serine carboxypeptidase-like protein [Haloechinothrix sp. LS1_15]|uniref:S10 family peptidase n=1 Tax=Haloechinothrix sp. LS1_15 TaxID=2652248 RepID=UPI0029462990|nr:peptidase S10 [Haloechinothrix sp. LS1_15]MDV6011503.1 peptidase S10 [Haloechinothrix sp. LS1_15]
MTSTPDDTGHNPATPAEDSTATSDRAASTPTDDLVTTQHALTTRDTTLHYTAQTGRMVLREEVITDDAFDGHIPKAEVFLTAYTLDGADPTHRPVTFAFNGGPGSSSVWLHLGILGPRRALSGDVDALEPPPYGLVDNTESLLEHSDLVFIDPVSTGYSRAAQGKKPKDYHGFTTDITSVGEIIRLWVTRNGRWLSPKFLAGESYGTVRAAGLAEHLQSKYGMSLNGLMLLSSVLDFGTQFFTKGNDLAYALYVPTYAAIAHYHGMHPDRSLPELLAEAEEFASRDYLWALARGSRLTASERADIATRLAALTGLSRDYVERVDLRVEHLRFFTELLRHRRLVVGRLDSRFTGSDMDYGLERMSADPSFSAIYSPFATALNHYVRNELGYENDLPYEVLSFDVNSAWSYSEFQNSHVTVADKLSAAMRANPHLKLHVSFGYYDGATPYYAAEHALAHLAVPDSLLDNITRAYYPAGHMMYIHHASRLRQAEDLAAFVRAAANR